MNIVDANLILRYLLQDSAQFIEQARDKIEDHNIFIPNEVIAEVVYVLEKVYKVERVHIFDSLSNLLSYSNISMHDRNILIEALKVYSEIKIDFVDSLLFAYSKIGGHTVFTFDKKLNQMLDELRNV
ncbi:pilus assembly protein [Cohnella sp. CIP 111063]|jgi:predicted nucleic-acid-binding protein|uniref:PIN domain-containing protein n=1 Tax=unclassified Cohnella TaxID=2636738 RepID=UPI000B8BFB70|nr:MULTISPECIES: PIN domain-containing protein [unclassified Cohnella]OXS61590.1 pilus assembly protein [Cohnella sp. CIP 111063]PRX73998.1 putative nucleic-acid-binding protein [Cohnella sp. SGD-V74]